MQITPSPLTVIIDPPGFQSGMPGDTLEVYVVVSNQSNQGAVIDVFFDEASETLNQWCKSLRERVALAPQQSNELTFQLNIPVDALPGTYDYTLVVDAPDHFPEDTPIAYPRQLKVMLKEHTVIRVKDPTFSLKPTTHPSNPAILKLSEPLQVEVIVDNLSDRVDRFRLSCPDLEEDWFTIRYPTTGLEGVGLLSGPSGLELNPDSQGRIWLQFHPPADTIAGNYSPTIRLHSANSPDLVLLDLVYIQIPPVYRLNVELNTILGKVSHSPGQYEVKLINQGNTPRELTVGIKSRDEKQLYTYQCDPSNVRVLPNKNFKVNLTVKPKHWWQRPLMGAGLTLNFIVELQDKQSLPLPENLPRGSLVWNPRPKWQLLLLVLGVLFLLGGLGFVVWLKFIKHPDPPIVDYLAPDSTLYNEGDEVRLNWKIKNIDQLSRLELKIDGSVSSGPPRNFPFDRGSFGKLKGVCQTQPPQMMTQQEILICKNIKTGVKEPSDYTFTLSAFDQKQDKVSDKTIKVKINEKPAPKVVSFQLDKDKYIKGNVMLLSWTIENSEGCLSDSSQSASSPNCNIKQLQIMGKAEGTGTTAIASFTPDKLKKNRQCKEDNLKLTCTNVPVPTPPPGKYTFELQAFPKKPGKPPNSLPTEKTIQILPKPFKITSFTLNSSQEPNIVLKDGVPVTLSWKVEGEDIDVELSPFGKVNLSGSKQLTANQALPSTIELRATDKFGNKDSRGFSIKVESPPPPPSPLPPPQFLPVQPNNPRPPQFLPAKPNNRRF